jgi:hypothetical protein
MTPNIDTIIEIEELLNLFRDSFDAFYEALKCIQIKEVVQQEDWIQRDENEGYASNVYYEVVEERTIYVPLTKYLDYFPDSPTCEF